ncbi:GNAT family N-acetyltransferase [Cellulomonas triticagri]|uniref:N-acetyltransferase n=1 Tax=Cellulomonas triticagri TaxID=2483352 RepID=A0A3M2JL33_9CELL|nr:GNAT family N-acetyltransferase [Cellulomonas triticagri]RMI12881.1 N-acetyltransferase [Cellulomonas triticagri]
MDDVSPPVQVRPADEVPFEDLQRVLGTRGAGHRCQCQRYRLPPGESFAAVPVEVRAERLRAQTDAGSGSGSTSGLVAYLGDEPVGWCAVAPRADHDGLVRVFRVPWDGRDEDRADRSVWAVTCLFVRAGFRRRGISRVLAAAAVEHVRAAGGRAVEAYPITTTRVIDEELHVGTVPTFAAAGLVEVSRPTQRRAVMRLDL